MDIKAIVGIKEAYELPTKLMEIIMDKPKREKLFSQFLREGVDLHYDFFRDFFEEQSSNRKDLMQDYTPDCICQIIEGIIPQTDTVLDICSGTGSLSLRGFYRHGYKIYCEEFSTAVLPILLFNLSIRGVEGIVKHKDVITQKVFHVYQLTKNGEFSDIEEIEDVPKQLFDVVISNPPYSMAWTPTMDERFEGYSLAPKKMADFAFVLDGLARLSDTGKAFFILPAGILFRSGTEGEIRRQLIDNNLIDSIIALPSKLFANTDIPVVLLILNKEKRDKSIYIINAADDRIKLKRNNSMSAEQIAFLLDVYNKKEDIKDYSRHVTYKEIESNNFNLNISRYIQHFTQEMIDGADVVAELIRLEQEKAKAKRSLVDMLNQLEGTDCDVGNYFDNVIQPLCACWSAQNLPAAENEQGGCGQ